jgi:hypothetical protein
MILPDLIIESPRHVLFRRLFAPEPRWTGRLPQLPWARGSQLRADRVQPGNNRLLHGSNRIAKCAVAYPPCHPEPSGYCGGSFVTSTTIPGNGPYGGFLGLGAKVRRSYLHGLFFGSNFAEYEYSYVAITVQLPPEQLLLSSPVTYFTVPNGFFADSGPHVESTGLYVTGTAIEGCFTNLTAQLSNLLCAFPGNASCFDTTVDALPLLYLFLIFGHTTRANGDASMFAGATCAGGIMVTEEFPDEQPATTIARTMDSFFMFSSVTSP